MVNYNLEKCGSSDEGILLEILHDLRAPLLGISMAAEMLIEKEGKIGSEKRRDMLRDISDCARARIKWAEEKLLGNRSDCEQTRCAFEELKLSDVAVCVMRELTIVARQKNIRIEVVAEECEPLFAGDRFQLAQLFGNLMSNAVKFTASGGVVMVKIEARLESVCAIVTNSGIAESTGGSDGLFRSGDEFSNGTAGERGYGHGLSIAWRVVSLHGGALSIESGFGRETSIAIKFPLKRGLGIAPRTKCVTSMGMPDMMLPDVKSRLRR